MPIQEAGGQRLVRLGAPSPIGLQLPYGSNRRVISDRKPLFQKASFATRVCHA